MKKKQLKELVKNAVFAAERSPEALALGIGFMLDSIKDIVDPGPPISHSATFEWAKKWSAE